MALRYQQFLGNRPGIIVELLDDSGSPYRVRTEDGFEFTVGAEDFRNYYRRLGESTPKRWDHLITDTDRGFVDSRTMAAVIELIHEFEAVFQDFQKARSFVRDALQAMNDDQEHSPASIESLLKKSGRWHGQLTEEHFTRLANLDSHMRKLLLGSSFAVPRWPAINSDNGEPLAATVEPTKAAAASKEKSVQKPKSQTRRVGMKNVEMTVTGSLLTMKVDLAKDFGPSKSGKTVIVATSEGTKTVPGREERIGLNVYRQDAKKQVKGRRSSFKNVQMAVDGDVLTIAVDLSQEVGPSKSGKTIIVGSTGGNQLIPGRSEKVGLNVYKKAG